MFYDFDRDKIVTGYCKYYNSQVFPLARKDARGTPAADPRGTGGGAGAGGTRVGGGVVGSESSSAGTGSGGSSGGGSSSGSGDGSGDGGGASVHGSSDDMLAELLGCSEVPPPLERLVGGTYVQHWEVIDRGGERAGESEREREEQGERERIVFYVFPACYSK